MEIECGNCGEVQDERDLSNCIHCKQQICPYCEYTHMKEAHGEE